MLAHELTHTIQQRAVLQRQEQAPTVTQSATPRVQRFGLDTVTNYIANKANIIPGFRLLTIVIGVNPINMASVDPSPANMLRTAIEFIPGGGLVTQALDNSGVFEKVANWAAAQIKKLASLGGALIQALKTFLKSLGVTDFARPGATWDRAESMFNGPITQVKSTVAGWLTDIITFVKDAILKPIGKLAEGSPAYPLLKALLGKDPVTGAEAPFDGDAVVGGLMELAGQGDIWANVKKANAIPRVVAWFNGAKTKLVGFVKQIPSLVIAAFKSLVLADIILVPLAFIKIGKVFGGFVGNFVSWALEAGWKLLEIVFDVVSPGAWGYVKRTGAALKSILKNPLPFVGNLAKAAKLGFQNFGGRFLTHLKAGLLDWLTGSLPGVYVPKALSLTEFGKLALSVLGLSWARIRAKIVKALGPNGEAIMKGLEAVFDVVKALVTGGPAAAWKVIQDKLTNLKDTIVNGIISFIKEAVVTKAIPKLIAMFIPGAGFISAIISIYDMVMVFVQKIAKIIQVVTAFLDSIVAIAGGAIGVAAAKVERILAGLLSLAINFLAGFAGLGKAADKVRGVITKVRDTVDKALDGAINFIIGKAKALFSGLFGKGKPDTRTAAQKQADLNRAIADAEALQADPKATDASVRKGLVGIKSKYKMTSLDLVIDQQSDLEESAHAMGEINPKKSSKKYKFAKDGTVGPLGIARSMLSWKQETKDYFASDKIWKKLGETPGDYEGAKLDIRHKVSISDTISHTDSTLSPKKPDAAAKALKGPLGTAKKSYDCKGSPLTKLSIVTAARAYLQDANNDVTNLFLGVLSVNRKIGRRYDPGDKGSASAAKHDAQKSDFITNWRLAGAAFEVTIERKSKARGTENASETWT